MRIMLHTEQFNQIMTMAKNTTSPHDKREVLRGVHLVCDQEGRCRAETCDGYCGGTYTFTSAEGFEPGECIFMPQPVRKCSTRENPMIAIESNGETVTITDWSGAQTVRAIKGDYIDMQRVYPVSDPVQTVYLNRAYLENVLKASKRKGGGLIKMEIRRPIDPVRITNGDHNMLVLPVRHPGNDW